MPTIAPRKDGERSSRPTRLLPAQVIAGVVALMILAVEAGAAVAALPVPVNLRLVPGVGSLSVRWGVDGTKELAGFRVRWRAVSSIARPWSPPVKLSAARRGITIRGLSLQPYEVRVR